MLHYLFKTGVDNKNVAFVSSACWW